MSETLVGNHYDLSDRTGGNRFSLVTPEKNDGVAYTPPLLADFVADQIVRSVTPLSGQGPLRLLDPALGDGALLVSLIKHVTRTTTQPLEVYGFDTDPTALAVAEVRLQKLLPDSSISLKQGDFLQFVLDNYGAGMDLPLFTSPDVPDFDLVIANPPYVRTQVMGASQAQLLARQFGLSGRVDLYYPFLLAIARVLAPQGAAGIIASNRFMTTRSGTPVRQALLDRFAIQHVWDLGDTKLFDVAVLPAVILARGSALRGATDHHFTSIYETADDPESKADTPVAALQSHGVVQVRDGRSFRVQHGHLSSQGPSGVWRLSTRDTDDWLNVIARHTWKTFGNIGKIRVGVKTCADQIFIRSDWDDATNGLPPELLRPTTTHHMARRYKPLELNTKTQILYPHEVVSGRRVAVNLDLYPQSKRYLETYKSELKSRSYVIDAGRSWYEIWVPQDPDAWKEQKVVFRDIAAAPTFWMDTEGTVVNGDCYWMTPKDKGSEEILWLILAVANSTFIEKYYDTIFNNKLYAGRRRFMTQYVEQFPIPDPSKVVSVNIIEASKEIYNNIDSNKFDTYKSVIDNMVYEAFGIS